MRRKQRRPSTDSSSIGNVVAKLYDVSLKTVWELVQTQGDRKLGQCLVSKGHITEEELERALRHQAAHRATGDELTRINRQAAIDLSRSIKEHGGQQ